MQVTFWSTIRAEGIETYEELLAYEEAKNGACSTTLNVSGAIEITSIKKVFQQESYWNIQYYVHPL
mgnify:CR=1 FL=1|jgi:hypothetical protein